MVQLGTVLTAISLHTSCHPIDVFPRLPVGGWTCSMLVSCPRPKHRTDVGVQAAGEYCLMVGECDGPAIIDD